MLSRVLEAEVMDSPGEAAAYDAIDHTEVNRVFVEDLLACGDIVEGCEVLDLGTGTALIPIVLCRQHGGAVVRAVDAAASMIELANRNIQAAGLVERIRAERVDAKRLPFADGSFTVVISNSIVHHIPEPMTVLAEAVRVTSEGGRVFFRDLMRPADEVSLERLVAKYTTGSNERQREMFADSLRAALSFEEIRSLVASLGFAPETVVPTSDRHWTWSALKMNS